MLFELAPALQTTRPDVGRTLKDQARSVAGTGHARLRNSLVVAQVMLSLLLLIAAGLFIRSLRNLRESGTGINSSNLISFTLDPALHGYSGPRALAFFRELNRNLGATAGVQSAALATNTILVRQGVGQHSRWDAGEYRNCRLKPPHYSGDRWPEPECDGVGSHGDAVQGAHAFVMDVRFSGVYRIHTSGRADTWTCQSSAEGTGELKCRDWQ